jgi:hypothetical protein
VIGDIYEVTMEFSSAFYNPMDCVFFYQDTSDIGSLGSAQGLAATFNNNLPGVWSLVASADVQYVSTRVRNLFNPLDIGEIFAVVTGDIVTETSVAFIAYAYRTSRIRTDIRRGQKRFPGVPETWVQHGVLEGDHTGELGDLSDAMNLTLAGLLDPTTRYTPVIVKRIKFTNTLTGKTQYRLPVTQGELADQFFVASSWLFNKITHQSSRGNAS